ncbi:hypothetical protein D9M69_385520 [compost metagenome]
MPLPDEVAQVVVELLARDDPEQLQLQAQAIGQGPRQVDVDAAGAALFPEAVGGEVLVDGHLEHPRVEDVVIGPHLCLRDGQAQQADQQGEQAHGGHSATATLSR